MGAGGIGVEVMGSTGVRLLAVLLAKDAVFGMDAAIAVELVSDASGSSLLLDAK